MTSFVQSQVSSAVPMAAFDRFLLFANDSLRLAYRAGSVCREAGITGSRPARQVNFRSYCFKNNSKGENASSDSTFIITCIPAVHIISFNVSFLSRVDELYVNWPAFSVWAFRAQLIEPCSANAEATGSNPSKTRKTFFRATSQLLKFRCTAMVTYSFHYLYNLHV